MSDHHLQKLLNQADERFGRAVALLSNHGDAAFIEAIRSRRSRQVRRRRSIGVLAVLMLVGGFSGWSWSTGHWGGENHIPDTIASNAGNGAVPRTPTVGAASTTGGGARRRLQPDQIKRIRDEIAALEAEANDARRFIEFYQAAEAHRERLAAAEAASIEPLLPPQVVADLEIDRAAAIAVVSADAQARDYNRVDEALESYRAVISYFPRSRWAAVAQQRSDQFQEMN